MKNYLVWYQHYVNSHNHWKFKMLRSEFGWSGEGRFWALNNLIGASDNAILDLGKKAILASTADDLGLTIKQFRYFIEFLDKECELIIFVDDKVTTEIVRSNLRDVMKSREKARANKNKHLEKNLPEKEESFPKLLKSYR